MSGYLLDTNIVSYLYNPERVHHGLVDGVLASFDKELPQVVSSITLAELRFGLRMTEEIGNDTESFARGIHQTEAHKILEVTPATSLNYANVKAAIATRRVKYAKRLPRFIEDWVDKVTDKDLAVDGNDLWIAAQAIETGTTLVTCDADFCRVIEDTGLPLSCIHITLKSGDLRRFSGRDEPTELAGIDQSSTILGPATAREQRSAHESTR